MVRGGLEVRSVVGIAGVVRGLTGSGGWEVWGGWEETVRVVGGRLVVGIVVEGSGFVEDCGLKVIVVGCGDVDGCGLKDIVVGCGDVDG